MTSSIPLHPGSDEIRKRAGCNPFHGPKWAGLFCRISGAYPLERLHLKSRMKSHLVISLMLVIISLVAVGCDSQYAMRRDHAPLVTPMVSAPLPPPAMPLPSALPAPVSQDAKMEWFREAKYGLFIHWGLYCIPAGEWQGRAVPGIGEWIMNREQIPVAEYSQLTNQFNPVQFDAEAWVQMAQDAGMKYIVITSKHHDGFAMYHSLVSPYNIYDATPFHRDPIRELAEACARHGLKFGFYYSQAQDWHEPGGAGNTWDFGPDDVKEKSGAYDEGRAAGKGIALKLWAGVSDVVRHAAHDDGRARPAVCGHRAFAATGVFD